MSVQIDISNIRAMGSADSVENSMDIQNIIILLRLVLYNTIIPFLVVIFII